MSVRYEQPARVMRRLRLDRRLSLEEVAQELGVSVTTLSEWERGAHTPGFERLKLVANFYGSTIEEAWQMDEPA